MDSNEDIREVETLPAPDPEDHPGQLSWEDVSRLLDEPTVRKYH